jgi:hypothetical protein
MTPHGGAKISSRWSPSVHRQRSSGEEKEDMRREMGMREEANFVQGQSWVRPAPWPTAGAHNGAQ